MRGYITVDLDDYNDEIIQYAKKDLGMFEKASELDTQELDREFKRRNKNVEILDYTDNAMLEQIVEKFNNSNWQGREEIFNKICS